MGSFLEEMFLRFKGAFKSWGEAEVTEPSCSGAAEPSCIGTPAEAVEYVVDRTYSRLRFLSGYSQRLRGPVTTTFQAIDELVEKVPGVIFCSRAAFSEDPRVNAFFAGPDHLQEVFSRSAEVHELLDSDLEAEACWALLCMKQEEQRKLGMSLVGDLVRKDVMQTRVSFTDHQILSPATSEAGAQCSLKTCIFNRLLAYIRKQARDEKIRILELEDRRDFLAARVHRNVSGNGDESREGLQRELDDLRKTLARAIPRSASLTFYLDLVAGVLENPDQYVSSSLSSIHLSRMGIKLDGNRADDDNEVPLFKIRVASQGTRVAALVRFPRAELLPRRDLVRTAGLFLTH